MQRTPIAPEPGRSALRRLALRLGLEFVTIDPARAGEPDYVEVSPLVAALASEDDCRARRAIPVAYRDGVVTVATPDPFADVSDLVDRPVRVAATSAQDLDAALAAVFGARTAPAAGGRLGERLVAAGAVAAGQVAAALRAQERAGGRLGELLVHGGAAGERDVAVALAQQLGLPFCDAATADPDPLAVGLVPEPLARRMRVVPLIAGTGWLELATAEALDDERLAALADAADGREVRQRLAAPGALEALLRRVHLPAHAALLYSQSRWNSSRSR